MPFNLKASSNGAFAQRLASLRERWAGPVISASVRIPKDMAKWIMAHELGSPSYHIDPTGELLVFPSSSGGKTFSKGVEHPGIRPLRMIATVFPEITAVAAAVLTQALNAGGMDDPTLIQAAMTQAATEAKALISESIANNLPGTREADPNFPNQGGKLQGQTASSVFDAQATIVEGT